jgi:hypothetical protein
MVAKSTVDRRIPANQEGINLVLKVVVVFTALFMSSRSSV